MQVILFTNIIQLLFNIIYGNVRSDLCLACLCIRMSLSAADSQVWSDLYYFLASNTADLGRSCPGAIAILWIWCVLR